VLCLKISTTLVCAQGLSLWNLGLFQLKDRTVPGFDFQLPFTGVCALLCAPRSSPKFLCVPVPCFALHLVSTSSIWFSVSVHLASGCCSPTSRPCQDSRARMAPFSRFISFVRWFQSRFLNSVGASIDFCFSFSFLESCSPIPRWYAPLELFVSRLDQAPRLRFLSAQFSILWPNQYLVCVWTLAGRSQSCS
jgi:hypothetical protein